jgi:histidyl-tRNA synthetase
VPALLLAEELRDHLPGYIIVSHCGAGSFKSQMKKADRSGARYALIIGDNELNNHCVGLKSLRTDEPQQEFPWQQVAEALAQALSH